ncbi:MAG: DUF2520 domain-containing protein [Muribaculaceae bacterium]|nr:DUF2520 domain-containing protein [Muribaculaceae bacterium]
MRVVILGSGNVATSLAHGLAPRCEVAQIYSRRLAHARRLADAIGCPAATDDPAALVPDADACIIAVSDDAIADVIASTRGNNDGALWVHTAGSKPISVFAGHGRSRYGVLWPMQSFSRAVVVPLDEVHFFAEGSDDAAMADLLALGHLLSRHVTVADGAQRQWLHVASVFSCNFANHLWSLADELLAARGLPFEAVMPLIRSTVDKLDRLRPAQSQTGPAVRHDREVIARHLDLLDGDKREIYRLISESIMNRHPLEDHAQ